MTKRSIRNIAAAFLLMASVALPCLTMSFFVVPVCEELGFGRGSFLIYFSLMTASGSVSIVLLGNYIRRHGVQLIIALSSIVSCVGFWLFSYANALWMFYTAAFFMGGLCHNCVALCANVIIDQTPLGKHTSTVTGIVMAGSGVSGTLLSLIVPRIIEAYGWRWGYRFQGVCWLAFGLLALVLLGKDHVGEATRTQDAAHQIGMTREEAFQCGALQRIVFVGLLIALGCSIQQQIPAVLEELSFDMVQVSLMMSIFNASLAIGKILQGMLCSRIGVPKGSYIMVTIFAVSFLLLMFPAAAYPGLVALAFGIGTSTTLMPIITRYVFGQRDFTGIWSVIVTVISIGTFVASPLWGLSFDLTGAYTLALLITPALLFLSIAVLCNAFRAMKK